jgi:hypothetical protein
MGQARRRKQQLGAIYGTPAGSPPLSPQAQGVAEVVVWGSGELAGVELVPRVPAA